MKTCKSLVVLLVLGCAMCWPSIAAAEWFSKGDHVVTVDETPVMKGSETLRTLSRGTNFRVTDVNGSFVGLAQEIEGRHLNGWVKQKDVLKLDANKTAMYATRDNLTKGQGQRLRLPKGVALSIQFDSDYAVDLFIVNEDNQNAYFVALENGGKGSMRALASKENVRRGSLTWEPSSDRQYYLIVDNSSFPGDGANSGRTIHYSLAYCIDDPKPQGPQNDKGIIIGRATLDFDDYDGRNGRYQKPLKVVIDVIDNAKEDDGDAPMAPGGEKVLKTLEVPIDKDGYFFLENLTMGYGYRLKKLTSGFSVPIPMNVEFGFGFLDEDEEEKDFYRKRVGMGGMSMSSRCVEPSILDMGHIAVRVNDEGNIQARIDAAHANVASEGGSISIGFGENSGPLDRHDWFLKKFPSSGWSKVIKLDRDGVYKRREESAKKKAEEKKKKEEEKRAKEEEAARKADDEVRAPEVDQEA